MLVCIIQLFIFYTCSICCDRTFVLCVAINVEGESIQEPNGKGELIIRDLIDILLTQTECPLLSPVWFLDTDSLTEAEIDLRLIATHPTPDATEVSSILTLHGNTF